MHTWIRSTLIVGLAFAGSCFSAWAEDIPISAAMPAPATKIDQTASGAAMPAEIGVIENEEAASETTPGEPLAVVEAQASSGPKTSTDKLVDKFMALDVDASDGVSMDEYITVVQQRVMARFAAMDADADGEVSGDEYRAFWKTRMAKWYRLKR